MTPDRIVELVQEIAKVDKWIALDLARLHPQAEADIHAEGGFCYRITIPLPPKRGEWRTIRRDEMPERVKIRWSGGYEEYPEEKSLEIYLSSINTGRGGFDVVEWSGDDGQTWNSMHVQNPDEPQPPLVVSTEGVS